MRILQIPTQFFYCAKLYTTARCLPFPIPVIIFKDLFHSVPSVILSSNKQTKKSVSLVVTLVQKPSFCFEKLGFSKINLILSGFFFPSCNLLMGSFYNISQSVFYFSILKNSVLLLKLMALFFTFLTSLSNKITTWIPSEIVANPCCEEKQQQQNNPDIFLHCFLAFKQLLTCRRFRLILHHHFSYRHQHNFL